jgi:hypothetical protein
MRIAVQLLFPIAFSATLAACGGSGGTPSDPAQLPSTIQQTGQLTPQSSNGTIIWKAGSGRWYAPSGSGQCGSPSLSSTTFGFTLNRSGTSCIRNQATPLASSGSLLRLNEGSTYTWTFTYYDGKPTHSGYGMGRDSDARSLIWQIHGYLESDPPCASLNFVNGPQNITGPQMWGLYTCAGLVWTGTYTPGETDNWKIVARVSRYSGGYTQLYRNGVLVKSTSGANYHNSSGDPWFNFGPYKYRWELPGGGGSNMYQVNATISNMTLTQ